MELNVTQQSETGESEKWHRTFAMSSNNRAWELSVKSRGTAEDREMLCAAHASAWHWEQTGNELNRMRAKMLLAEVHALLGFGSSAFTFATEMRDYFLTRYTPDWEIAFTHVIYAHAAYAAGESMEHRSAYEKAIVAMRAIEDAEDQNVVSKTFDHVPAP